MTGSTPILGGTGDSGAYQNSSAGTSNPEALAAQAESLLINGRLEEAEDTILSALKKSRDSWQYYAILGRIRSAQNRTADAREAFRYAAALAPTIARPHWLLGQFLFKERNLSEAEGALRKAVSINPKISAYHSSLGALLFEQGWIDDAYSSLRRAIRLDRRYPQPREILAKLLAAKGNYRGAEKSLAKALTLTPKSFSVLWSLSNIFEQQGKTDQVIACTEKLLKIDPGNVQIHIRISNQYMRAGRLQPAEKAIRAALALQPIPANYYILSNILCAQARTDEALAAMEEACKLDPENQVYGARLSRLAARNAGQPAIRPIYCDTPAPTHRLFTRVRIFLRRRKID